jgi:hypothetical protein
MIKFLIRHSRKQKMEQIGRLADDVWKVAKKLGVCEEASELKRISSLLHDIRREINA